MAGSVLLKSFARISANLAERTSVKCVSVRYAGYWNKDWRPGPYPVTPEQREAAAKKYGLRVEDYEPYPEDGFGYGDYPKLPYTSAESRDPYQNWDMPTMMRNFGEPMHTNWDIIQEDKWDASRRWQVPPWKMALMCIGSFGGIILTYYLLEPYPFFVPMMPKQLPEAGVEHYTFESQD